MMIQKKSAGRGCNSHRGLFNIRMIEESYERLRKEHKLPEFDSLNNEFEISIIDSEEFLVREIRRKITEKICFFTDIIGGVINTESSASAMLELGNITEEDIKKGFSVYRKLMYWERYSAELSALSDDNKEAEFIRKFYEEWIVLKMDIATTISKIKETWKMSDEKKSEAYFS